MSGRKFQEGIHSYTDYRLAKPYKLLQNMLSEDGTLKYDFMTSLYNIAIAKIVTHLWMKPNAQQQIAAFYEAPTLAYINNWRNMEFDIVTEVQQLKIPDVMREDLAKAVSLIGKEIKHWMHFHDGWAKDVKTESFSADEQIHNIVWTARGRIDYAETARSIFAADNGLGDREKYSLACNHCLESEISMLAPIVKSSGCLSGVTFDKQPMVFFWTVLTGGNSSDISLSRRQYRSGESVNEYVLQCLFRHDIEYPRLFNLSEAAIRFVWSKLTDEEKSRNVSKLIRTTSDRELTYSIFSNLCYEEQRNILKDNFVPILSGMSENWLWEETVIPVALHVLDVIDESSYFEFLTLIYDVMNKHSKEKSAYDQYKSLLKLVLKSCSENFKDLHFQGWKISPYKFAHMRFSWEKDIDVIELIFKYVKPQRKREIMFERGEGIDECVKFIIRGHWRFLELLIEYCVLSDDDVIRLKERLVRGGAGYEIAENFMQTSLEKIECFMNWAGISDEEKKLFRMSCFKFCDKNLEAVVMNNKEEDFGELDNNIKWCASNNEILFSDLKARIPKLYFEKIRKLIVEDKYESLDRILKWCFSNDEKQMEVFKSDFCKDSYISHYHRRDLFVHLTMKDHSLQRLNKFVQWCFSNEEEVRSFKSGILYGQNFLDCTCVESNNKCLSCVTSGLSANICLDYVLKGEFELADKCTRWLAVCDEEVSKFKAALMLSDGMKYVLNTESADRLFAFRSLEWFNPSLEVVAEFKKLYPVKMCPFGFYTLLDNFVDRHKTLQK